MGNSNSTNSNEKERQRLQIEQKYGVLIPPAFVASSFSVLSSVLDNALVDNLPDPSLISKLQCLSISRQLLSEYLYPPGVTVKIPTANNNDNGDSSSGSNHVIMSVQFPSTVVGNPDRNCASVVTSPYPLTSPSSFLSLDQQIYTGDNNSLGIKAMIMPTIMKSHQTTNQPTGDNLSPSIRIQAKNWSSRSFSDSNSIVSFLNWWPIHTTVTAQITDFNNNTAGKHRRETKGYIDAKMLLPSTPFLPNVDIMTGCWMDLSSITLLSDLLKSNGDSFSVDKTTSSPFPLDASLLLPDPAEAVLNVQAAASHGDNVMAIHIPVPLSTTKHHTTSNAISTESITMTSPIQVGVPPFIKTMISWNLNSGSNATRESSQSSGNVGDNDQADGPPLWLTLQKTFRFDENEVSSAGGGSSCGNIVEKRQSWDDNTSGWMLNLSQIWNFDRVNLNLLDNRAPWVRNHFGWVFQISQSPAGCSVWNAGFSWQLNRTIAIKTMLEQSQFIKTTTESTPSTGASSISDPLSKVPPPPPPSAAVQDDQLVRTQLKTAIILKHWNQPQATLSLQHRYDFGSRRGSFVGFGLEIEPSYGETNSTRSSANHVTTNDVHNNKSPPPPTRISIPSRTESTS